VFARELTQPGETGRLSALAGAGLVERGYHSQVSLTDGTLALFHLSPWPAGRRAIRQQGGEFYVGDDRQPPGALVQAAAISPTGFSPNVLLRPVVQDTLFPTVCYVAGPNELAYLAQLRDVYAHFGVPMPLMYPRASATIVDSAARRFLTKYRVPLESLQPQDEAALNALLKAQIPAAVDEAVSGASDSIEAAMRRVAEVVPVVDPTLEGAVRSTLGRMQHDLRSLQGKIVQAAKRRDETLRRQYVRTRALVFPGGQPQERRIGFISFLNQYGPALLERLQEQLPLDLGRHWIVTI
jgi:bacillithiol biosynthesis cysteine-adding enzyme BshC